MPFSLSSMFRSSGSTSHTPKSSTSSHPSTTASSSISSSPPLSSTFPTSLSDSVSLLVAFLQSPLWCVPLSSFIDVNCLFFDTSVEHQLQHTAIHQSYVALCESLLAAHLETVGLSHGAFVQVCDLGLQSTDVTVQRLIGEVLLLDEYQLFHKRMVNRNIELDALVLSECLNTQHKQKNKDKQRARQQYGVDEGSERRQMEGEEAEALPLAIELSLLEEESNQKEREREAAEIEYAIQLSLALQAEELRHAEEKQREIEQQQQKRMQQPQQDETQQGHEEPLKEERVEEQKEKVECCAEEKETAPPIQPSHSRSPSVIATPVISPSPTSTSASLAPLKHLRRAYENNVQRVEAAREERAAVIASQNERQQAVSVAAAVDDSAARQQFLRAQRERLIARNKEAGSKQLSAFNADLAATERAVEKKHQQQHDTNRAATTTTAASTQAVDAKRAAMQAVLKARLREEAEKTIATRTEQRSLDEQLQMLQNLATS